MLSFRRNRDLLVVGLSMVFWYIVVKVVVGSAVLLPTSSSFFSFYSFPPIHWCCFVCRLLHYFIFVIVLCVVCCIARSIPICIVIASIYISIPEVRFVYILSFSETTKPPAPAPARAPHKFMGLH